MTLRRALLWLIALLTVLAVAPVTAQDVPALDQTFSSDIGYSFSYPSSWILDASTRSVGQGRSIMLAFLASNEEAVAKLSQGTAASLEPGEVIIGLTIGELGAVYNTPPT